MAYKKRYGSTLYSKSGSALSAMRALRTITKAVYKKPYNSKAKYSKKGTGDNGGVTQHYDHKVQYRKKRMPYKKRKQWRNFVRKVRAVEVADRGLQTVVFNNNYLISQISGNQEWLEAHLFSCGGTAGKGCRDLVVGVKNNLFTQPTFNDVGSSTTPVTQNTSEINKGNAEILFQSAVLDITWTNESATQAVEGDIYHVEYIRKSAINDGNFVAGIDNGFGNTIPPYTAPGGGTITQMTPLSRLARGVTLFDMSMFLSTRGIKILKKEKVFLAPGSSVTKQIRVPKNIKLALGSISDEGLKMEGLTKSLISCWKSTTQSEIPWGVRQKWTRTYKYTVEGVKDVRGGYVADS